MQESRINRRTAMKGAAGITATGVAWAAPQVTGLSLRPNYAAAQSAVTSTTTITGVDVTLSMFVPNTTGGQGPGASPSGSRGSGNVSFSVSTDKTDNLPSGVNKLSLRQSYHDEAFDQSAYCIFGTVLRDAAANCNITKLDATGFDDITFSSPSSGATWSSLGKCGPTMPTSTTVTLRVTCT